MQSNKLPEHRLLTRAEVAEIFQVSPSTVTRWAEAGKLPMVKTLGGHRRYEAETVMKLAQESTLKPLYQTDVADSKESNNMEKTVIEVPAMYGDHHVLEVRRLLLAVPGVTMVYASSCFRSIEVTFDPAKTSTDELHHTLEEAGYFEPLQTPVETGVAVTQENGRDTTYFRHTTAFEQTKQVVSFAQDIKQTGRVLWPCPGVGVIKQLDLDKEANNG